MVNCLMRLFMKSETRHDKIYHGSPSGGGRIVCSCSKYETPIVDDGRAFTLGLKVKTVEQYFAEHLAAVAMPETTMKQPSTEQAVAAAQHPVARQPKRRA